MKTIPQRRSVDCAQDIGNEMVTCAENSICRVNLEGDAVFGPVRRARRGSFGLSRHRVALPTMPGCGARTSSFVPEGTRSAGSSNPPLETVGYCRSSPRDRRSTASGDADMSNRAEDRRHEVPESPDGFVLHDPDGERLMRRGCPEIGGGVGGRMDGVKAPEGWRSPRPGGLRYGRDHDEHPWELRRRVSKADRGLVRRRRMPESGDDLVSRVAAGELIMPYNCPEFDEYAFLCKAKFHFRLDNSRSRPRWRGYSIRAGAIVAGEPVPRATARIMLKNGPNDHWFVEQTLFREVSPERLDSRRGSGYGSPLTTHRHPRWPQWPRTTR